MIQKIPIFFFFFSLSIVNAQTDNFTGRYITKGLHSGFCLNQLILNNDDTFVYHMKMSSDTIEVKGTWKQFKDTLTLFSNKSSNPLFKCVPLKFKISKNKDMFILENPNPKKECYECNVLNRIGE